MKVMDMKLGTRLGAGFAAILVLMAGMTAMSLHQMNTIRGLNTALDVQTKRLQMAEQWKGETRLNLTRTLAIAKAGNQATVSTSLQPAMKESSERISTIQESLEKQIDSDTQKRLLADIGARRKSYVDARNTVFDLYKNGQAEQGQSQTDSQLVPASDAYLGAIAALVTDLERVGAERSGELDQRARSAQTLLLVLTVIGVVCGGLIAWGITRSVTTPVRRAASAAQVMARGDLSQPLVSRRHDEIGDMLRALADMQEGLRGMVTQIRQSTDGITTASTEIATGNQDLSSRTEQTASNLQQTASSMEQLTGTVKQTADSARTANQLASSASSAAARGGDVVSQVVSTMDDITHSSRKIADIIGVIDGIAFQTNILALNAAVEAARAGEQGRGFAVVASEVRNLAQRSAQAAKEIKSLIGASVEKVESGSKLVQDAGTTMSEIVASVQRVSDIIGEITAAASEQSDGIGQVNTAVTQLDQMTQQNAALVEESAAAAESLREQAHRLAEAVDRFKVTRHEGTGFASIGAPSFTAAAVAPAAKAAATVIEKAKSVAKSVTPVRVSLAKAAPQAIEPKAAASAPVSAVAPRQAATSDDDWEQF